ncbi:MAG: hypothetical protein Q9208_002454 [Pyrenodesmia sp. 3 TL-2023]
MAEEMDEATAATILAIQLQDIQELESDNGNQVRTIDCDAQLACRIYQEDLERQVRSLRDRHVAIRFGESPLDNEDLPPASSPSIPAFQPLDPTESQTSGPAKPTDSYDVDQQSEELGAPSVVAMLDLECHAMEQERLPRKRKATRLKDLAIKFDDMTENAAVAATAADSGKQKSGSAAAEAWRSVLSL